MDFVIAVIAGGYLILTTMIVGGLAFWEIRHKDRGRDDDDE